MITSAWSGRPKLFSYGGALSLRSVSGLFAGSVIQPLNRKNPNLPNDSPEIFSAKAVGADAAPP